MLTNQCLQLPSWMVIAQPDTTNMVGLLGGQLLAVLVFSVVGVVVFIAALFLIEKLTPFSVKHEIIEEHNTALSIVLGSIIIGMSLIIAASVLG